MLRERFHSRPVPAPRANPSSSLGLAVLLCGMGTAAAATKGNGWEDMQGHQPRTHAWLLAAHERLFAELSYPLVQRYPAAQEGGKSAS